MLKVDISKVLKNSHKSEFLESEAFVSQVKLLMEGTAKEEQEILKTINLGNNIVHAENERGRLLELRALEEEYEGTIYTKDQIKEVALKYNLRFLETNCFSGYVPPELGAVVKRFSSKHCLNLAGSDKENFYILGPKKSFSLQKRPVDPLLFYRVSERYREEDRYVLVHKWGNDFTVFRRLQGIMLRNEKSIGLSWFLGLTLVTLILLSIVGGLPKNTAVHAFVGCLAVLSLLGAGIMGLLTFCEAYEGNDEKWDSPYR